MKDMFNRIMNSEFMMKFKNIINGIIDKFASSSIKEKVDNTVNNHDANEEGVFSNFSKKVQKFVDKHIGKKIKSNKLLKIIGKVISMILALGFFGLVAYVMIKLLPEILTYVAIMFAITIVLTVVMAILDRAAKPIIKVVNVD